MKINKKRFTAPVSILKLISRYQPSYIWWSMPQIIISSLLPLLYVYAPKLIIEKLTNKSPYPEILSIIITYSAVLLLLLAANKVLSSKSTFASEKFARALRFEVGKIALKLEIKDMESASQRELVSLANNVSSITETFSIVQKMLSNIITIVGLAAITAQLDRVFFLSISAVLTVKIVFTYVRFYCNKKARKHYAKNDRAGDYLMGLAYFDQGAQKEIRINNLQNWFIYKVKAYRSEMVQLQYKDFRRNAVFDIIMSILIGLQSLIVLLLLSSKYGAGLLSIADFTMYFSAITSLTAVLTSFTEQIGNYNNQLLNVKDYEDLVNLSIAENNGVTGKAVHMGIPEQVEIKFSNVSFTYPNSNQPVLKNINLTIHNNEKVVLVGLNGAGKTTLVKLLCKFYRPSSGTITINGVDIWSIPNTEYYRLIAAVFQDYQNFAFSIADNISFDNAPDKIRIAEILNGLGMGSFIASAPHGLDTFITKNFTSNGIELSGGEGQKLAIARAVYKNAPLLILDEPTASLDAKAESDIYKDFYHMSLNKTAIYISHRLAASTFADTIVVLNNGDIVEYGSHAALMKKGGLYAEMFNSQSKPYVEVKQSIAT